MLELRIFWLYAHILFLVNNQKLILEGVFNSSFEVKRFFDNKFVILVGTSFFELPNSLLKLFFLQYLYAIK